jgi:sulfoxide reductase heme-binding subunit YedZ
MSTLLAVNTSPHLFWITSRAAGTAALVLSSLGVCAGLMMSGRFMRGRGADLRPLHEALSLATIAALLVHGLSLVGDKFLHPSLIDVVVPFAGSYKTGWTSLGIIAAYALILLGPSYYARRLIGQERWRRWHRFTALAWIAGLVHAFGEGTDAGSAWFVATVALTTIPAVMLLVLRNFQASPARQGI